MAVDLAAILPLSEASADSALTPLAGQATVVRVVRTMRGAAVVAAAESLVLRVRETLAAEGIQNSVPDNSHRQTDGRPTAADLVNPGIELFLNQSRHHCPTSPAAPQAPPASWRSSHAQCCLQIGNARGH